MRKQRAQRDRLVVGVRHFDGSEIVVHVAVEFELAGIDQRKRRRARRRASTSSQYGCVWSADRRLAGVDVADAVALVQHDSAVAHDGDDGAGHGAGVAQGRAPFPVEECLDRCGVERLRPRGLEATTDQAQPDRQEPRNADAPPTHRGSGNRPGGRSHVLVTVYVEAGR